QALDFLHSRGRVHRDVKPANLLITRKGDLKLGDFGAAGVENSSRMIGTQRFMAPERLKGHRATAQSDLWSLALSLAIAALGDDFISQASNQFEQLDVAGRVRPTLGKATTLSAAHTDFLYSCLSRDPARRPALRDLMTHPFLSEREDWQAKCPEVALAMRDRKRLQSGDGSAMSTEEVLDSLCRVRAEENLIGSGLDPSTAADLAHELGMSAESLVGEIGNENADADGARDSGGRGGGVHGDGSHAAPRRSTVSVDDQGERAVEPPRHEGRVDGSRSSSPISMQVVVTTETVGQDCSDCGGAGGDNRSDGHAVYPVATPRNRSGTGASSGSSGFGDKSSTGSSKRNRRRAVEITSAVKLTPHKRRGERKASQTKRNGHCCTADGARSSRGKGDRSQPPLPGSSEDSGTAEPMSASPSAVVKPANSTHRHHHQHHYRSKEIGHHTEACRGSFERKAKRPRTAASRTLPSRTDVRMRSIRGVFQLADQMKAQIAVRDRVHRLRVYPNCFSGREAVQWMLDGCHASSVIEAENIGNEMMKHSVFQHILNSHVFEDSSVYYQFTDGETPPPPSRGSRRLRQIARVFGGHVARKLV
ncbi:unnamed protein product, partial [Scytosiphon promiscuus]